jgi:hypothetical protein
MVAPMESPMNRMPSGPNASGPADLSWALPAVMLTVEAPKAITAAQHVPAASLENKRESVTNPSSVGLV